MAEKIEARRGERTRPRSHGQREQKEAPSVSARGSGTAADAWVPDARGSLLTADLFPFRRRGRQREWSWVRGADLVLASFEGKVLL